MLNSVSVGTERFLSDLNNIDQRMQTAQRQLSSGLRMQEVSDAPDQVSALLQMKANIAHNDQLKYNLGSVQTEINTAEGAVNTATSLMDRARQIAAQGNNGVTSTATRTQLAGQVKDILTEMYGLTNTNVEGRFVFSGNNDGTAPFAGLDLTQANGVGAYQGGTASRTVEHPNGSTIPISLTADEIFNSGGPSTNVLQALTGLYNNLTNNNVAGLAQDATNLDTASSYLSGQQARYGELQNHLTDAVQYQSTLALQYQQQLSTIQDADSVAAITSLQQNKLAQDAALQSHATSQVKSLFSFLG